jgi:hypothetical protein
MHSSGSNPELAAFCAQVMPDPGAPAGAVRGRWRIQPPCGQVGPLDGNSVFTNNNKGCVPPAAGCAP